MANNVISEQDKAKMFDFLKYFQDDICSHFGEYDICSKEVQKFLSKNGIYLGRMNKSCRQKALKSKFYILFEHNKPKGKDNDIAHHLLRHIRNAIAHGRIEKNGSDKFKLQDFNPKSQSESMFGIIDYKLFFKLIDLLKNQRTF